MLADQKIEEKIQQTDKKLKEFSIALQRFNDHYQEWLDQLGLTAEELKEHANNPENFSPEIWQQLQEERKKGEEELAKQMNSVPDPLKTKKTLSERGHVQQHWLFVR